MYVKRNLISVTPTASLGVYYRIVVVALCNIDFIPRFPSLCFYLYFSGEKKEGPSKIFMRVVHFLSGRHSLLRI
jgi:hypothetical protein